jgi:hypothetical protein
VDEKAVQYYHDGVGGILACASAEEHPVVTLNHLPAVPTAGAGTTVQLGYEGVDQLVCQLQWWLARQRNPASVTDD